MIQEDVREASLLFYMEHPHSSRCCTYGRRLLKACLLPDARDSQNQHISQSMLAANLPPATPPEGCEDGQHGGHSSGKLCPELTHSPWCCLAGLAVYLMAARERSLACPGLDALPNATSSMESSEQLCGDLEVQHVSFLALHEYHTRAACWRLPLRIIRLASRPHPGGQLLASFRHEADGFSKKRDGQTLDGHAEGPSSLRRLEMRVKTADKQLLIRKATRARAWQPGESGRLSQREEADLRNFTTHCLSLVNTRQELETKGRIEPSEFRASTAGAGTPGRRANLQTTKMRRTLNSQAGRAATRCVGRARIDERFDDEPAPRLWRAAAVAATREGSGDEHQARLRPRRPRSCSAEASQPPLQLPIGAPTKRSPTVSEGPRPAPPSTTRPPGQQTPKLQTAAADAAAGLRLQSVQRRRQRRASGGGSGARKAQRRAEKDAAGWSDACAVARARAICPSTETRGESSLEQLVGGGFAYQTLNDFQTTSAPRRPGRRRSDWWTWSAACANMEAATTTASAAFEKAAAARL
uniref:Protein kinase domain-containing protein n=1 Tax=Macrostomum lignano TaxID=282301 RepID=A0A1I8FFW8_9PLAT